MRIYTYTHTVSPRACFTLLMPFDPPREFREDVFSLSFSPSCSQQKSTMTSLNVDSIRTSEPGLVLKTIACAGGYITFLPSLYSRLHVYIYMQTSTQVYRHIPFRYRALAESRGASSYRTSEREKAREERRERSAQVARPTIWNLIGRENGAAAELALSPSCPPTLSSSLSSRLHGQSLYLYNCRL